MSFELQVSEEAIEDLHQLIDSLPTPHRRDALNGIDAALERLAANPLLATRGHLGRPTYHFEFRAGDVHYHWGCTFRYTEDESGICVTHVFRAGL